jgi:hypothetical protein
LNKGFGSCHKIQFFAIFCASLSLCSSLTSLLLTLTVSTLDNWSEFAQALDSTTASATADEALRLPVHLVVAFIGSGCYTLASLNKEWSAAYREQYESFQILHNTKCPKSSSANPLWDCCPYGRPSKMRELPVSQWVKMRELLHDTYDRPFSQVHDMSLYRAHDPCWPKHTSSVGCC